ncbi:HD domain-containing protein [Paenibacillus periandrae]|uniref:HD domain-containing protein n=1 Tax=Paenibacillus periandrae TaxID=1761741 RepID=UPI001F09E6AA|nr:HD domain-containing protein [Paenibacillus periandrae]
MYNSVHNDKSKLELDPPKLIQFLEGRKSEFLPNIYMLSREIEFVLSNEIPKTFPKYTLHDINHSIRIMENMYELICDIELHNDLDITILIYSALLHDIGMSVTDEEKVQIKSNKYLHSDIVFDALLEKMDGNEIEAMQEYIRKIHAKRSAVLIKNEYSHYFSIPSYPSSNIVDEVATICKAHTEDISYLKQNLKSDDEKGKYKINPYFCGILLRLADICDFNSQRTPRKLYELINPENKSDEEWRSHFIIENSQIIKKDSTGTQNYIAFFGRCDDAKIHRNVLGYFNWVNSEIYSANLITSTMLDRYKLNIRSEIENNIEPIGYSIPNLKLDLNFNAITKLLMGENVYGNRLHGFRELIQNAIDATKVREEIETKNKQYGDSIEKPLIKVILNKNNDQIIIKDNGTGMTLDVIKNYFLNIGVSFYKSDDFLLKRYEYSPIGNYGIGFLKSNNLLHNVSKDDDEVVIDVSKYLVGIEGTITIDVRKQFMHKGISNINYKGKPYYISNSESFEIVDYNNFDVSKICVDNKVRFYKIPIIDRKNSDEYDKFYEVLQDVEASIDKIGDELKWVTIFLDKSVDVKENRKSYYPSDDKVLDIVPISFFVELGHYDYYYPIRIYSDSIDIFYDEKSLINFVIQQSTYRSLATYNSQLYIRNVLCSGFNLKLMNTITDLEVTRVKINAINRSIIPDVSRNNLVQSTESQLQYALSKVIITWALENLTLDLTERELLMKYKMSFFKEDNIFLKNLD